MSTSTGRFMDYSTLPVFPAPASRPQHRWPAWLVGIVVSLGVTFGGAVLGPVLGVAVLGLSPLYPLNLVLGVLEGGVVGLAVGAPTGVVTAVVVAATRSSAVGARSPR